MKLITTIFSGEQIEVTLVVQSKNARGSDKEPGNGSLITRYRSKIGNESLIFNPTIALTIRGRDRNNPDAWVPLPLFYRFTSSLSVVYQNLHKDKLYMQSDGTMYVDRNIALSLSRRLSLYRNSLTLTPGVASDRLGKPTKAIDFIVDEVVIGTMSHVETLNLVDIIDHLDVITFALQTGIVDEMETMNTQLGQLNDRLGRIEQILLSQQTKPQVAQTPRSDPFSWKPLVSSM